MARRIHKRKAADSPERMSLSQYLSSFSGPIVFFLVIVTTIFVMSIFFRITNIQVEGANGQLHTNYEGKARAAADALLKDGFDFVHVHVEAPDEMGHQGSWERKVQSIEYLDQRLIKHLKEALDASGEPYRMMVLPDHPTPIRVRTHTSDPVPFLLYDSTKTQNGQDVYSEKAARESGLTVSRGCELIDRLFEKTEIR